jgi:3-oxoacyl-[acyl-carrier protein] reductase
MDLGLKGKIALVLGAAGGLGGAIAASLASEGAHID